MKALRAFADTCRDLAAIVIFTVILWDRKRSPFERAERRLQRRLSALPHLETPTDCAAEDTPMNWQNGFE